MGLGRKALGGEVARGAPATHLRVVVLILAHRRGGIREVRDGHHERLHGRIRLLADGTGSFQLLVDGAHRLFRGLSFLALARGHEGADLLGDAIAVGLQRLLGGDGRATRLVEGRELIGVEGGMAVGHVLGHFVKMVTYVFGIKHGKSFVFRVALASCPSISQGIIRADQLARIR